jgi:predicted membrane channel-forming protein YqfA (hemolysin III family)
MNSSTTRSEDRISFPFFLALGILTMLVFIFITLPADFAMLVCIVRGPAAYFVSRLNQHDFQMGNSSLRGLVPLWDLRAHC